jgi:hypothetical protein
MRRSFFLFFAVLVLLFVWSCSNNGSSKDLRNSENKVVQQADGTISLKLDKAARYCDTSDSSENTAEWKIVISKPGSFKIWLSSATKDTTDLHYANSVKISFLDKQLEAIPACDKVVRDPVEFPSAYYRADSYMGSFFIAEPGEYNLQIISEKVIAKNAGFQNTAPADDTVLMSVILTPLTR